MVNVYVKKPVSVLALLWTDFDFQLCLGKNATNETASKILSKMITAEIVGGSE